MDHDTALATNRAHWDALAAIHSAGGEATSYYDADALVAGRDSLTEAEHAAVEAAVGSVAGLDVLHVQCHLGYDAISLARAGARVTGVDFSPRSLEEAAALAERCRVAIDWVLGDATALPAQLHGRFDLAYATIGVLGWIDDVGAWMRSVASTLRPGGHLVLVEIHPLYVMVGAVDPLTADFPYAHDGPRVFDEDGTYAAPSAQLEATRTVEFAHSIGEVVTAALAAGLRIDGLTEHMDVAADPRGTMLRREADGRMRLRLGDEALPLLYALRASAP